MSRAPSGKILKYTYKKVQKNGDIYVFERETKYDPGKKYNVVLHERLLYKIGSVPKRGGLTPSGIDKLTAQTVPKHQCELAGRILPAGPAASGETSRSHCGRLFPQAGPWMALPWQLPEKT